MYNLIRFVSTSSFESTKSWFNQNCIYNLPKCIFFERILAVKQLKLCHFDIREQWFLIYICSMTLLINRKPVFLPLFKVNLKYTMTIVDASKINIKIIKISKLRLDVTTVIYSPHAYTQLTLWVRVLFVFLFYADINHDFAYIQLLSLFSTQRDVYIGLTVYILESLRAIRNDDLFEEW